MGIELVIRSFFVILMKPRVLTVNGNGMVGSDASAVPGNGIPDGWR